MNEQYKEQRKEFLSRFARYLKIADSERELVSPSGLYKLEISKYGSGQENSWDYSRGVVSEAASGKIIADVKRNYGHFWHTWVEHPNGSEYLLCGEDYQGYSIVNLTRGTYQAYFPEAGYQGAGFCWSEIHPSPDKKMLAVEGCIWACPYELVFYDFREPDILPYRKLGQGGTSDKCEGWLDNETFVLMREIEIRKSDGIPYERLSETEQEILDADSSLVDYKSEKFHVQRSLP